jgi:hypothetical protein
MSRKFWIGGLVAAALLLPALPAQGAVTIGSDLSHAPVNGGACALPTEGCTAANTTLPGAQVSSPIDGVVVRWRLRFNSAGTSVSMALRVIRPSGSAFTGVNTSTAPTFSSAVDTTVVSNTQQPIKAGDQIALDVLGTPAAPSNNLIVETAAQAGVTFVRWVPPLADGATAPPTATFDAPSQETTFNADVEPDADCDGLGDETQDPAVTVCPTPAAPAKAATARLQEGTVTTNGKTVLLHVLCAPGGGNCDANSVGLMTTKPVRLGKATASAKKGKRISLGSAPFSLTAAQPGTVTVPLTKAGRKLFRLHRKAGATATITGGGGSSTAIVTIKVKGKKKKR